MCNLYTTRKSAAEVAAHFGIASSAITSFNVQAEVYPGYPGMVIRDDGEARTLKAMTWGFPLALTSKKTGQPLKPKPVNNAREDKLGTAFWRDSFVKRRCLIPVSAWCEAEGEKGRMTRTWYSLHGQDLFAVAGVWRPTVEWGDAYSMVMVDGCPQMADVHDRMPVLLTSDEWDMWTQGTPGEAIALARTCHTELAVDGSAEPWLRPKG
jgi:putative SOS response-associated peptidase YedK